jgi:hypothetical protein
MLSRKKTLVSVNFLLLSHQELSASINTMSKAPHVPENKIQDMLNEEIESTSERIQSTSTRSEAEEVYNQSAQTYTDTMTFSAAIALAEEQEAAEKASGDTRRLAYLIARLAASVRSSRRHQGRCLLTSSIEMTRLRGARPAGPKD